jgi:hypothetical protein
MSRGKKTPPTAEALLEMRSLAGTYGRGGAVIAAAWVDDALEEYLRRFLSRDPKLANSLLQPEGALGTFGVRIKLAYALGMISEEVRRDLDVIRLVRNDFAHLRDASGFENPSVIQRCRGLYAFRCYASAGRMLDAHHARDTWFLHFCWRLRLLTLLPASRQQARQTRN